MKREPNAGVEFSSCRSKGDTKICVFCSRKQRERCELLARLDLRCVDDPRNAEYDKR